MIEFSINHLTKYYGANKLFENITFEVKTGEKIGLIGRNGCGKTTLMKILTGVEGYQEGELNIRKGSKAGYLDQIPDYGETKTIEVIRSAYSDIFGIRKEMTSLEESFDKLTNGELEKAVRSYGKLTEQYERLEGYELETKINKVTEGLEITDTLRNMPFDRLSGGERTRAILAKILLEEPDILLLDEPTNHLDLAAAEWLESFLKSYKGTVLVISHDRYFLDSIADRIIELEVSRANIYSGNYSYYVIEKERRFLVDYKNYLNQQKKIEQMEKQIERYRIWGTMRDSEKMFKRAKELEKRLEKIDVLERPVPDKRKVRFDPNTAGRSGKIVLSLENVNKSFDDKELLKNICFPVYYQESACIIGKNGCGKSTLLRMIMGETEPDGGIIKLGSQVKIGYLPQHVIYPDEDMTLLEYFSDFHNITYEEARFQLAKVLFFSEDINKKIKYLSGGEKSRLRLCSLSFEKVNVMVLDEPTNHLDIDSREVLEKTLCEFEGTLLFVSHDRYFINKVADKIIEIENNTVKIYPGDYTYYVEEYKKAHAAGIQEPANKNSKDAALKTGSGKPYRPNRTENRNKKIEQLEQQIGEMEGGLKLLEQRMNSNITDAELLNELFLEKEETEAELEKAYELWEQIQ